MRISERFDAAEGGVIEVVVDQNRCVSHWLMDSPAEIREGRRGKARMVLH